MHSVAFAFQHKQFHYTKIEQNSANKCIFGQIYTILTKVLLLSDSHSYIDERILYYAQEVDEVWHAGDIGSYTVIENLQKVSHVKAVYGNIDGSEIRKECKEDLVFTCEKVKVYITHIGGYPTKYAKGIKEKLLVIKPKLFICGHSHILKIMYDKQLQLIHMNPGACGIYGFHKVRTMIRFVINQDKIEQVEVIELGSKKN